MKNSFIAIVLIYLLASCNKKGCYKCTVVDPDYGEVMGRYFYCDRSKKELIDMLGSTGYKPICDKVKEDDKFCFTCNYRLVHVLDTSGSARTISTSSRDTCGITYEQKEMFLNKEQERLKSHQKGDTMMYSGGCLLQ